MNLIRRLSQFVFCCLIVIFASCGIFTVTEPVVLSAEEHEIILAHMNSTGAYGSTFLLLNKTISTQTVAHLKERLAIKDISYDKTILVDYNKIQKTPGIYDIAQLPDSVILLDPDFLDVLQDTCDRWDNELKELYPGTDGYIYFSRPVISDDGQSAILEYCHVCGYWCGGWGASLMIKENGVWKISEHIIVAIA